MNKVVHFIKKHEKAFFFSLLILFSLIFLSTYLFTTIPLTQGWGEHYVDLISSGKMPYKDFYYYLPPLNLIIDTIFWKLSFGHLIIYQIYRLIERLIIISLIYSLLCKVTKPRYACIGTCVGTIMFSSVVWDLVGDYNQTCLLFVTILTTIYFKYIQNFDSTSQKKQNKLLFLGGIVLGLSFLLKQPLFVDECLVFFPLLTIFFIIKKKKGYLKSLIISIVGMIIPIVFTSGIMLVNGSFSKFISQVYLGATGKGSLYSILMIIFTVCFKYKYILISLLFIFYFYLKNKNQNEKSNNQSKSLSITVGLLLLSVILFVFNSQIVSLENLINTKIGMFGILVVAIMAAITFFMKKYTIIEYVIYICFMLLMMAIIIIKPTSAEFIYNQTSAFNLLDEICVFATIGCISMIFYCIFKYYKTKNNYYLKWSIIFAGAFIYEYITAMGSKNNLQSAGTVIEIAALISFILQKFENKNIIIKNLVFILSLFICVTVTSQKITNAYSWWGWNESITDSSKKYSINVPGLEGYRVSYDVKNMYEKMYEVLDKNTNKNSVIYGYPHIKIFNVLLKNTNMNTFVPVPFYDVCSDTYAIKDAKLLEKNNPDIVVWVDMDNSVEIYEQLFRDGKPLGQRKIMKWFSKAVDNGDYTLIGQYNSIFIYKLNDGSKVKYKYIKDKKAKNYTINNK